MSTNIRTLIAECVGAFLLVFLAVGGAVIAVAAKVGLPGVSPGTSVMAGLCVAGLVLLGVAASVGPFSRIHLRPAVTFALARRRSVAIDTAVDSWIGQAIGAIGAGVALYFFVPWATGLDISLSPSTTTVDGTGLVMLDLLIAGLLSVLLLATPLLGAALVAIFATPGHLVLATAAPARAAVTPAPPVAPVAVAPRPMVIPEPDLGPDPEPEPAVAPEPEPEPVVAGDPEPVVEAESDPLEIDLPQAEVPEESRPLVFASVESTTSKPLPPRSVLTSTRVAQPATRVVAPFPPAPAPSPFPLRREVAPARHASAFSGAAGRPDAPKKKAKDTSKNAKAKDKKRKAQKAKGKSKRKSESTVTVQVKVTDKHGKTGRKK